MSLRTALRDRTPHAARRTLHALLTSRTGSGMIIVQPGKVIA